MLRTTAIAIAFTAALASRAGAQDVARPETQPDSARRSTTLETVTVVAKAQTPNMFSRAWHMEENRRQVLAMMDENRRLAAELHGYDRQVAKLEKKLSVVKANYDAKAAALAATDSLTADTRRRRLELEEKLRRLEGGAVAVGPAAMEYALPGDER